MIEATVVKSTPPPVPPPEVVSVDVSIPEEDLPLFTEILVAGYCLNTNLSWKPAMDKLSQVIYQAIGDAAWQEIQEKVQEYLK